MHAIKKTILQSTAKLLAIIIVPVIFASSLIWSTATWYELESSLNISSEKITINLGTFYCASLIIISGCGIYMLAYELFKKQSLPKKQMQTVIYILMIGVAILVFLPRYAGRYYISKVEQEGYSFNQEKSFQWLFYRKLVFTRIQPGLDIQKSEPKN
ncbi:MAG: hypothetical protein D6B28_03675 [Gammaproteobacteria bacterium]|nr:MAG: hypothetical protein D6B28_03675 [Gammaproteobacteria bacterium]